MASMRSLLVMVVLGLGSSLAYAGDITEEYFLYAGEREGFIGDDVVLPFFLDVTGDAINGYSWGACHDANVSLTDEAVERDAALEDIEFELHVVEIYEDGWSVDALISGDGTLDGRDARLRPTARPGTHGQRGHRAAPDGRRLDQREQPRRQALGDA